MQCKEASMCWLKFGQLSSCEINQDCIESLENWNLSYHPCFVYLFGDVHSNNIYFNNCIFLISWDTEMNANLIFVKQLIQMANPILKRFCRFE